MQVMEKYNVEFYRWLDFAGLTDSEREELLAIRDNEEEKAFRFKNPISFGTAGLRSVMCLGISMMNRFTVAQTTRALGELVCELGFSERGVVIVFDSRNNSELFAKVSASVLANMGIKVYIFDSVRPTPELSFALRELSAIAGINITASHNPKEYNGYKAYWEDGAQIGAEIATEISKRRENFEILDTSDMDLYDKFVNLGKILVLGEEFDELYLGAVLKTAINPDAIKLVSDDLRVVYTPLHGAGYKLVPKLFSMLSLKHLYTVTEQMIPDGNFPTVEKPNPEYREVFKLGIEIADRVRSNLVIATDPDSDRVGVVARRSDGEFVTITGNQMGALLLDYVIRERRASGKLPDYAFAVKSIVSTDMARVICQKNNVKLHDVLTGFKYIGETIKNYEKEGLDDGFLLGFEESYGYLLGSYARDKDAVGASMLILEMTAYYQKHNMTLLDALDALYEKYGYYAESTIDIYMEGYDGADRMKRAMERIKNTPPKNIGGVSVVSIGDYNKGEFIKLESGEATPTGQPKSNVLYYTLKNDDKIIVRPSGTEPKIKIYILAHDENKENLDKKTEQYSLDARKMLEA